MSSRIKALLGLTAGAGAAALTSSDAEAGMPPAARRMYEAALKEAMAAGNKDLPPTLFRRYRPSPADEILRGLPIRQADDNELWKPPGTYAADKVRNIPGHLSGMPDSYATPTRDAMRRVLKPFSSKRDITPNAQSTVMRIVPHADARVKIMTEKELREFYDDTWERLVTAGPSSSKAPKFESQVPGSHISLRAREEMGHVLRSEADVLKIPGVDDTLEGTRRAYLDRMNVAPPNEYIILQPEKFSAFYEQYVTNNLANPGTTADKLNWTDFLKKATAMGLVGTAGVAAMPEDAEAISARDFFKQSVRAMGGIQAVPKSEREILKTGARTLPKEWLDKISKVDHAFAAMEDAKDLPYVYQRQIDDFAYNQNVRGFAVNADDRLKMGDLANSIYLKTPIDTKGRTPQAGTVLHETGHIAHGSGMRDLPHTEAAFLDDMWNWLVRNDGLAPLENRRNVSIHNSRELFAEAVNARISDPAGFDKLFPEPLKEIIHKYMPALAAGGVVAGISLTPEQAEAAARLGPLTKQTLETASELAVKTKPYHESKHLLGHKLNLSFGDMPEASYTIRDLKRSTGKRHDYFAILENEAGERYQLPMSKAYFKSLNKAVGTNQYLDDFVTKPDIAREAQATKSLELREATKPVKGTIGKANAQRINKLDPSLKRQYVYFQANDSVKPVYMPKMYAWFLEKLKKGRIVQETSAAGKAK
jgi:hypothetical protein